MAQTIHRGIKSLIDEANAEIETVSAADAIKAAQSADVVIVDIRDPREIERDGKIPGAFSCTRGMLEFWIDPASPYAKPIFQEDKKFIFHCAGGMRSALAAKTAKDMGLKPVAHMGGGFAAWRDAGGPVEKWEPKKKRIRLVTRGLDPRVHLLRTMDCRVKPGNDDWEMPETCTHDIIPRRSACFHRLARRPHRRSQGQGDRRSVQTARRTAAAVDDYLAAHIPGAVFFDVDAISDHDNPRPHMFPDAAQFARDIEALGISTGDTVVAYDSGGWVAAPRAWWMLLSFGYPNVRCWMAALKKWTQEGRPTHSGKVTPKPGKFVAKLDPSTIRSQQQVLANIETPRRATGRRAPARAL